MRNSLLMTSLLAICLACSQTDKTARKADKAEADSLSIEGGWVLVESRVKGKVTPAKKPQQFKLFHNGYFSFIHYNPAGKFQEAGAGTYGLDGHQYKETLQYCSDSVLVGASDWQEWKLAGDTLYFYGFKKAIDKNGKDLTEAWGGNNYEEKRVRAKR